MNKVPKHAQTRMQTDPYFTLGYLLEHVRRLQDVALTYPNSQERQELTEDLKSITDILYTHWGTQETDAQIAARLAEFSGEPILKPGV